MQHMYRVYRKMKSVGVLIGLGKGLWMDDDEEDVDTGRAVLMFE